MDIDVNMGDSALANGKDNLRSSGIGSCVAITLYDRKRKIGVLLHAVLPQKPSPQARKVAGTGRRTKDSRYVDSGIDALIDRMEAKGVERRRVEATVIGGAKMFPGMELDIGSENVSSARKVLKKHGIKIVAEDVGGGRGRCVELSTLDGRVTVETALAGNPSLSKEVIVGDD